MQNLFLQTNAVLPWHCRDSEILVQSIELDGTAVTMEGHQCVMHNLDLKETAGTVTRFFTPALRRYAREDDMLSGHARHRVDDRGSCEWRKTENLASWTSIQIEKSE